MIEKNNFLKKIDASKIQSDSKLFLRNGPAIFIIKSSSIKKNLYNCNLLNFRMTEKKSIDINTENDLKKLRKYK
jgi:CMP-N-acetylneuraminic acid synthetase